MASRSSSRLSRTLDSAGHLPSLTEALGGRLPPGGSVRPMDITSHGIARTVATTIAIGAVLAPAAAAQQDLRSPDTRDAAERAQRTQDLRSPDTRDAAERAQRTQDLRSPDTR